MLFFSPEEQLKKKYVRKLGEVSHLDFSPASQDLHQVKAFVCLEPTDDEEEEDRGWGGKVRKEQRLN